MIAYELLMEEMPKESAISETVTDKNVLFHWDLIMHDFDTSISITLLQDVVTFMVYYERILFHQQIA